MINFKNDYSYIACKEVLVALSNCLDDFYNGYGEDIITEELKNIMKKYIDKPFSLYLLPTGTGTNKTVIDHLLKPYEAVITVKSGHIAVHETGAIESTGHKILLTDDIDGKVTPGGIAKVLKEHIDYHMVKPKAVYLSNATEIGTIYTKSELSAISEFCHQHHLLLYLDGARLGNALCAKNNDLTINDIANLTDVFYIGGAKNGALIGEMVIITNPSLMNDFSYTIKQNGQLYSKGFVTAINFTTLFTNNLYFKNAANANETAKYLQEKLESKGYQLAYPLVTNQLFIKIKPADLSLFQQLITFEIWENTDEYLIIRLVTSFHTTYQEIDEFISQLKK